MDFTIIVYLITNAMQVYVLYRFLRIFFKPVKTNKIVELITYSIYYTINSYLYLTFNTPTINLLSNIIMIFLLSLHYRAKISIRLINNFLIFAIRALVEGIVYFLFKNISIDFVYILVLIVNYLFSLLLHNAIIMKSGTKISFIQWLGIFIIPMSTILVIELIYRLNPNFENQPALTFVTIVVLLFANFVAFYLYRVIIKSFVNDIEQRLVNEQNVAYLNQFNRIKEIHEENEKFKHDVKNQMLVVKDMIESNANVEAIAYLDKIYDFEVKKIDVVDTENLALNSLLNYKIQIAKNQDIDIKMEIDLSEDIWVEMNDLIVVIGNLLDNAIAAVIKTEEIKEITCTIKTEKKMLWISISNPYDGALIFDENGRLKTMRKDRRKKARGILSVSEVVNKYDGLLEFDTNNHIFEAKVFLYNT